MQRLTAAFLTALMKLMGKVDRGLHASTCAARAETGACGQQIRSQGRLKFARQLWIPMGL
jgi:hypothetical protein